MEDRNYISEFLKCYDEHDFGNNPEKMYTFLRGYAIGGKLTQLCDALAFARKKHSDQCRQEEYRNNKPEHGKMPYIVHPLRVACYLIGLECFDRMSAFDKDTLLAAIVLHDLCEDCRVEFGQLPVEPETQKIVRLLTKTSVPGESKEDGRKRYFKGISSDVFAIISKAADRIDNLSTITHVTISGGAIDYDRIAKNLYETLAYIIPMLSEAKSEYPRYLSTLTHIKDELERDVKMLRPFFPNCETSK